MKQQLQKDLTCTRMKIIYSQKLTLVLQTVKTHEEFEATLYTHVEKFDIEGKTFCFKQKGKSSL